MDQQTPIASYCRWAWVPAIGATLLVSSILFLCFLIFYYDINSIKPVIKQIIKEKTGRELSIHGPIRIVMGSSLSLVFEDVALQNAPWGSHLDMLLAKQIRFRISLFSLVRKRIEVISVSLVEPAILIETDRYGRSNLSLDIPKKPLAPARSGLEILLPEYIHIEKGRFSYKDANTGQSFLVAIDRLQARRAKDGVLVELETEGNYASEHFRLQGKMGTVESLVDPREPWRLDITVRACGWEIRMDGFLPKPITLEGLALRIKGAGKSTVRMANLFGLHDFPELGPFKAAGEVFVKKDKQFHISGLEFVGKGLDGRGNFALALKQQGADIKGSLFFKRLEVTSFLRKGSSYKQKQIAGERKKLFCSRPLLPPFARIGGLAVELDLKAERVLLPHTILRELKTKIHTTGDRFSAKSLQLKAGGGEMNGALDIKLQEGKMILVAQADMSCIDIETFLGEKNISGKAAAEIDLVAQGSSVAALLGGLNGKAFVALSGLRFENNPVKPAGSQFGSIMLQIFAPVSKDGNTTEINCLVSGFAARKGLVEVTTLVADTHEVVVLGKGSLNLEEETLDLSIRPFPKRGVGGISLSLTELTKAFKLGGTLAEPSLRIDPLRSALAIGKMVGGMVLFGPAGAAVVFAGQTAGEGDFCLAAMEAAREAAKAPEASTETQRAGNTDQGEKNRLESVESIGERAGRFFKKSSNRSYMPVDVYGGGP
jgi:AsmA family protein